VTESRPSRQRYYRKVIRIRGCDSPNVRLALAQIAAGQTPTGEVVVPGVLSWEEYQKRSNPELYDESERSVILNAEFYEGKEVKLFPGAWLDRAEQLADLLGATPRTAQAIGCDPAEGGDSSSWSVIDELGLIDLITLKTPDTSIVTSITAELMRKWRVPAERVAFDRGGGGKEHVDRLRSMGEQYERIRTVAFGEGVSPVIRPQGQREPFAQKVDVKEDRYAYINRRAEMYGRLSELMNPSLGAGFAIPRRFKEIRSQLFPIPKLRDPEGRLKLPPKNRKSADSKEVTLVQLIGHSPDEADSLVLALHALHSPTTVTEAWVA